MKVLIIGDSYGLPRFCKNNLQVALSYEETYPEVVRQLILQTYGEDVVLVNNCRHANTSFSLVQGETNMLAFLEPDYVVLQLGLTDLWPSKLRNVQPLQWQLAGKDPWVQAQEYKEYMTLFCREADKYKAGVILVNIACLPRQEGVAGSEIMTMIKEYNTITATLAQKHRNIKLVDLYQLTAASPELFGDDGIHLDGLGSSLVATEIFRCLDVMEAQRI